jgi:DNA (cytosine-5)-methyltransferase 3A
MTQKKHSDIAETQSCKTGVNGSADFVAVSLFDGMSCLQLALNKIGKIPTKYFASEVDKYAMQVTMANFPNTNQIGDVRNVKGSYIGFVHLLAGGSPCQSFSFAGKRKGMSTKDNIEILTLDHYLELKNQNFEFEGQSYLFWEYMRILEEIRKYNPDVKFLLENVIMGSKWQKVITQVIGINPICINSSLVSAQNRNRLYWTNIGAEPDGLFGDLKCTIPQPKDKGILLKYILESEVDEKYFISQKMIDRISRSNNGEKCFNDNEKSMCLAAGYFKQGRDNQLVVHNMMPRTGNPKKGGTGHLTRSDGKTYCLDTGNTNAVELKREVIQLNPSTESGGVQPYQQNRVYDTDGLSPAIMAQMSCGSHAIEVKSGTLRTHNDGKGFREVVSGKGATIPARAREDGSGQNIVSVAGNIRRLTPIECERLQTVPDNYTNHVSDTQRYKMLGNGWTIDVIAHILSYLT